MKFIKLTRNQNNQAELIVNPLMISQIEPVTQGGGCYITMMNGNSYLVVQSAQEILDLIKKAEYHTITTWDTSWDTGTK